MPCFQWHLPRRAALEPLSVATAPRRGSILRLRVSSRTSRVEPHLEPFPVATAPRRGSILRLRVSSRTSRVEPRVSGTPSHGSMPRLLLHPVSLDPPFVRSLRLVTPRQRLAPLLGHLPSLSSLLPRHWSCRVVWSSPWIGYRTKASPGGTGPTGASLEADNFLP